MNMRYKNMMVANLSNNKRYSLENTEKMIQAQIDNSIELGWDVGDIWLVTNFDYEFRGVKAINAQSITEKCLTGSKIFGMKFLFENGYLENHVVWSHDFDAWQNYPFNFPPFKDVGIVCYSNTKYNGGSIFWRESGGDIIQKIVQSIEEGDEKKEEPTLNRVLKSSEFKERVTVVNNTFNVGCSGYVVRYNKSEKPIRVCHFHPSNGTAWETHALDRNGLDVKGISDRLEKIIRQYYPHVATELSSDGKKAQAERKAKRLAEINPVNPIL
jgi:hypothetical protein